MHLRSYRAVMWDIRSKSLLVIPQGSFNDTIPVIALKPDRQVEGRTCFAVTTLGSKDKATFNDVKSYTLLLGSIAK
jgi:hypothetical protein